MAQQGVNLTAVRIYEQGYIALRGIDKRGQLDLSGPVESEIHHQPADASSAGMDMTVLVRDLLQLSTRAAKEVAIHVDQQRLVILAVKDRCFSKDDFKEVLLKQPHPFSLGRILLSFGTLHLYQGDVYACVEAERTSGDRIKIHITYIGIQNQKEYRDFLLVLPFAANKKSMALPDPVDIRCIVVNWLMAQKELEKVQVNLAGVGLLKVNKKDPAEVKWTVDLKGLEGSVSDLKMKRTEIAFSRIGKGCWPDSKEISYYTLVYFPRKVIVSVPVSDSLTEPQLRKGAIFSTIKSLSMTGYEPNLGAIIKGPFSPAHKIIDEDKNVLQLAGKLVRRLYECIAPWLCDRYQSLSCFIASTPISNPSDAGFYVRLGYYDKSLGPRLFSFAGLTSSMENVKRCTQQLEDLFLVCPEDVIITGRPSSQVDNIPDDEGEVALDSIIIVPYSMFVLADILNDLLDVKLVESLSTEIVMSYYAFTCKLTPAGLKKIERHLKALVHEDMVDAEVAAAISDFLGISIDKKYADTFVAPTKVPEVKKAKGIVEKVKQAISGKKPVVSTSDVIPERMMSNEGNNEVDKKESARLIWAYLNEKKVQCKPEDVSLYNVGKSFELPCVGTLTEDDKDLSLRDYPDPRKVVEQLGNSRDQQIFKARFNDLVELRKENPKYMKEIEKELRRQKCIPLVGRTEKVQANEDLFFASGEYVYPQALVPYMWDVRGEVKAWLKKECKVRTEPDSQEVVKMIIKMGPETCYSTLGRLSYFKTLTKVLSAKKEQDVSESVSLLKTFALIPAIDVNRRYAMYFPGNVCFFQDTLARFLCPSVGSYVMGSEGDEAAVAKALKIPSSRSDGIHIYYSCSKALTAKSEGDIMESVKKLVDVDGMYELGIFSVAEKQFKGLFWDMVVKRVPEDSLYLRVVMNGCLVQSNETSAALMMTEKGGLQLLLAPDPCTYDAAIALAGVGVLKMNDQKQQSMPMPLLRDVTALRGFLDYHIALD